MCNPGNADLRAHISLSLKLYGWHTSVTLVLLWQDARARHDNHPEAHGTARQEYAVQQNKTDPCQSGRRRKWLLGVIL